MLRISKSTEKKKKNERKKSRKLLPRKSKAVKCDTQTKQVFHLSSFDIKHRENVKIESNYFDARSAETQSEEMKSKRGKQKKKRKK